MKTSTLMAVSVLALSACGGSMKNPTANMAKQEVQEQLTERFGNGTFEIQNFEKTNGYASEMRGRKLYTLEYKYDVYFEKGVNAHCIKHTKGDEYIAACFDLQVNFKPIIEPKYTETVEGELMFGNTEKGWVSTK